MNKLNYFLGIRIRVILIKKCISIRIIPSFTLKKLVLRMYRTSLVVGHGSNGREFLIKNRTEQESNKDTILSDEHVQLKYIDLVIKLFLLTIFLFICLLLFYIELNACSFLNKAHYEVSVNTSF